MNRPVVYLIVVALVVVGTAFPANSAAALGEIVPNADAADTSVADDTVSRTENHTQVEVGTGAQLATVIQVTDDDTRTDMREGGFDLAYETDRLAAVADRSEELRERAAEIRDDYTEATEAYREGELTRSEFAQRLATLSARAGNVLASYNQLRSRMATVSDAKLRAAGVNRSALRVSMAGLDSLQGAGTTALLARFTGQSDGEVQLRLKDGLFIEVESEGGERSREIERPRDDDPGLTVNQSTALDAARSALSTPERGTWTLQSSDIDKEDGVYTFEFGLSATNLTGEAEVEVDGSSGTVFSLEEEIEQTDGTEKTESSSDELVLSIVEGALEPEETVTIQVRAAGRPVRDAVVRLNDREVGTTGNNGTIEITLPPGGDVEVSATKGDSDGRLRFELEETRDADDDGDTRELSLSASLDNKTVTIEVTKGGSTVNGASVFVDGARVGSTEIDGLLAFPLPEDTDEFEVTVLHDGAEIESEYVVQNGSLVPEK
ncbi:DUF7096 domain-containing protein [Halobaculum gomorrense]|uniref:DUF7096 domain-containing protein n=1 Tax=Halobaculum gomorrense TaxID=43928 RepID=A0A1M5TIH3_9EURY|nr:hypothetical protein [Halobaculum gomorrense]SHH50163.1 hypothetical protein SAMN05443636_2714 [Halobaculum gomorrense]